MTWSKQQMTCINLNTHRIKCNTTGHICDIHFLRPHTRIFAGKWKKAVQGYTYSLWQGTLCFHTDMRLEILFPLPPLWLLLLSTKVLKLWGEKSTLQSYKNAPKCFKSAPRYVSSLRCKWRLPTVSCLSKENCRHLNKSKHQLGNKCFDNLWHQPPNISIGKYQTSPKNVRFWLCVVLTLSYLTKKMLCSWDEHNKIKWAFSTAAIGPLCSSFPLSSLHKESHWKKSVFPMAPFLWFILPNIWSNLVSHAT
jgi:hypothetical protein